jgi:hypothetical protein
MAVEANEVVLEPATIEGITLLTADGATEAIEVVLDTIGTEACDLIADDATDVVLEGTKLLVACDTTDCAIEVVLELGADDLDLCVDDAIIEAALEFAALEIPLTYSLYSPSPSASKSINFKACKSPSNSKSPLGLLSAAKVNPSGAGISFTNSGNSVDCFNVVPYVCTYNAGLAVITPKYLYSFLICTCGASHCTIIFLGLTITASFSLGLLKMTRRLTWLYGNQRSIRMACGFAGMAASLSIMTLRGGGGSCLPEMVIFLMPIGAGASGGDSRMISGSGVSGRGGCCLMMSGGAGPVL